MADVYKQFIWIFETLYPIISSDSAISIRRDTPRRNYHGSLEGGPGAGIEEEPRPGDPEEAPNRGGSVSGESGEDMLDRAFEQRGHNIEQSAYDKQVEENIWRHELGEFWSISGAMCYFMSLCLCSLLLFLICFFTVLCLSGGFLFRGTTEAISQCDHLISSPQTNSLNETASYLNCLLKSLDRTTREEIVIGEVVFFSFSSGCIGSMIMIIGLGVAFVCYRVVLMMICAALFRVCCLNVICSPCLMISFLKGEVFKRRFGFFSFKAVVKAVLRESVLKGPTTILIQSTRQT